jgi:hypothetical protein
MKPIIYAISMAPSIVNSPGTYISQRVELLKVDKTTQLRQSWRELVDSRLGKSNWKFAGG